MQLSNCRVILTLAWRGLDNGMAYFRNGRAVLERIRLGPFGSRRKGKSSDLQNRLLVPIRLLNERGGSYPISNSEVRNSRPESLDGPSGAHAKAERIALDIVLAIQPVQIERAEAGVLNLDENLIPAGSGRVACATPSCPGVTAPMKS